MSLAVAMRGETNCGPPARVGHAVRIARPVKRIASIRLPESFLIFVAPQTSRRGTGPHRGRKSQLGPREAMFGEREGTNAFAGDGKNRVADGRKNRRES